jgi:hypothetical protein
MMISRLYKKVTLKKSPRAGKLAKKKTRKLVKTTPMTTNFEYWCQTSLSPLVFPTIPAPLPGSTAPSSPPFPYPSPHNFIKTNFVVTNRSPFGNNNCPDLPASSFIREVDVICAALGAGYGKQLTLSSYAVLKGSPAAKALRRYLGYRLETLVACLDYSGATITPKPFFKFIETTEKAALSFVIGCIGTHVAARLWMVAGGVRMTKFLHSGIYTQSATVLPSALVKLSKIVPKGKIPDFLVQDSNHGWHVFESKGGAANNRWKQIVAGLKQLENVTNIKLASAWGPVQKPKTAVCVHTVLANAQPLSITLVDPPGVPNKRVPDAAQPDAPKGLSITLVPGVSELLTVLEAIEWFHGLEDGAVDISPAHREARLWVFKGTSAFHGVILGLPCALLDCEDELRLKVALYLALQESLEVSVGEATNDEQHTSGVALPPNKSSFVAILTKVMDNFPPMDTALAEKYNPSSIYESISNALLSPGGRLVGTLHAWSHCLQIASLADKIQRIQQDALADVLFLRSVYSEAHTKVSESGLYIEVIGRREMEPSNEVA